jgi:hypothetical protein
VFNADYKQYQEEVTTDVGKTTAEASCQPILFVGSGCTKRYAKGLTWEELLGLFTKNCPLIDKDVAFYKQAHGNDLTKIGTVFSQLYHEWAWNAAGRASLKNILPRTRQATSSFNMLSPTSSRRLAMMRSARRVRPKGMPKSPH